jgi:UDP-N-acetylmuramoyl-L-alanyl-D-glutamate--2,6-diaminopimelate ligase
MLLKDLLPDVGKDFREIDITDITCDSRKVTKGCAFVCISGFTADGH